MEQKKIILIIVLVLALLMAVAYPLYNRLSQEGQPDQLVTMPQKENAAETKPNETQPTQSNENPPVNPEATQPEATQPEVTQPEATNPEATQPHTPEQTQPDKPAENQPTQPPQTPTTEPPETPTTQPTDPPVSLEYDFTVVDGNGKSVKLSDYVGKPIVLNFWASWCGPCKSEMPEFQQVFEQMGEQVQFLMVNATASDTMANAKSFVAQYGYTFPVLFDTRGEALHVYGVDAFPTTFFLDKTGTVAGYAVGAISKDTLLKGIGMINK